LGVAATIRHRVLVQISDTFIENIEEYICPGQRVEVKPR
jgi:predicted RNA-binding protein with RPS1 domain